VPADAVASAETALVRAMPAVRARRTHPGSRVGAATRRSDGAPRAQALSGTPKPATSSAATSPPWPTPEGQHGRPSRSLTPDQATAVITAAATLPGMELPASLKGVRRPAALMHAYIVLSLLAGIRTKEARALRLAHVDLYGDPSRQPVHAAPRPSCAGPGTARLDRQPGR
jgi:integrase